MESTVRTLRDGQVIVITYGTVLPIDEIHFTFRAAHDLLEKANRPIHLIMDALRVDSGATPRNLLAIVIHHRYNPVRHPHCATCSTVFKNMFFRALSETIVRLEPQVGKKLHNFTTLNYALQFVEDQLLQSVD